MSSTSKWTGLGPKGCISPGLHSQRVSMSPMKANNIQFVCLPFGLTSAPQMFTVIKKQLWAG